MTKLYFTNAIVMAIGLLTIINTNALAADGIIASDGTLNADSSEPIFDSRGLDCILVPNKTIDVSSPVEGVVDQVMVNRGDKVKKGQVLMTLHSEVEQAQVQLAEARAEFGLRTVNRNEELGELLSDHEKDEIMTDSKLAELEVQEIKTRLSMKTIVSPLNGLVIEKYRDVGEFVSEEPVMMIVSIDPLYAELIAPVQFLGKVKKGDKATVIIAKPFNVELAAKVKTVDPVIDPASGTFRIRLQIKNPKEKIPSGLRCQVALENS